MVAVPLCLLCTVLSSVCLDVPCMLEVAEPHRLYVCARCGEQVHICRRCDRGQVYCAGECAAIRRHDSRKRAGARYQTSHHGAMQHAARQRQWRARKRHTAQKVTHQGSPAGNAVGTVSAHPTTPPGTLAYAHSATRRQPFVPCHTVTAPRCAFCGRTLSLFMRTHGLRRRL